MRSTLRRRRRRDFEMTEGVCCWKKEEERVVGIEAQIGGDSGEAAVSFFEQKLFVEP